MALYLARDMPRDKVIWDVGHQSYTHKRLSGRRDSCDCLRQHGGMSGFPKRKESPFDAFDTGHSSTSISAGLGLAQGRDLLGEDYTCLLYTSSPRGPRSRAPRSPGTCRCFP